MADSRKARRIMPRPMIETPRREPLTMLIMRFNPRDSEEAPDFGLLNGKASASTKSISAVGTERVPSLSFSRLMRMPFGVPSERSAGTRNNASVFSPGSAPSGRASVAIALASTLEQNHLAPLRYHFPFSSRAVHSLSARSDPPRISVMNMAPPHEPPNWPWVRGGSTFSRISGGAYRSTSDSTPPVMPVEHA